MLKPNNVKHLIHGLFFKAAEYPLAFFQSVKDLKKLFA